MLTVLFEFLRVPQADPEGWEDTPDQLRGWVVRRHTSEGMATLGQGPSTVVQVALLVLVVVPGAVYQFLRERWRGPVPGERDLGERVLRAVTASLVLDGLYVVVAGPWLVELLHSSGWGVLQARARLVGAVALVLFVLVPAGAAGAVSWWQRRSGRAGYRATTTAWEHMFRQQSSCFVRARLKDGKWVGGWYGSKSYVSCYPYPEQIFLESAWQLLPDGGFARKTEETGGLHLSRADTDILEVFKPNVRAPKEM